jgi:hypothetical protein
MRLMMRATFLPNLMHVKIAPTLAFTLGTELFFGGRSGHGRSETPKTAKIPK